MSDAPLDRQACATCGRPMDDLYCSHCGEKRLTEADRSFLRIFIELAGVFLHYDTKGARTLGALLFRPGFLTTEFWAGRRVRYMWPLQVLLVINIGYFAASWVSHQLGLGVRVMFPSLDDLVSNTAFSGWARAAVHNKLAATHADPRAYATAFNAELERLAKSLVILLVPILAVFLRVFYWRGKLFLNQLVAATHLVAFYALFWSLMLVIFAVAGKLFGAEHGALIGVLRDQAPWLILLYVVIAFRKLYGEAWWLTIVKGTVFLFLVLQAIKNIYDFVLFWLSFWLVH